MRGLNENKGGWVGIRGAFFINHVFLIPKPGLFQHGIEFWSGTCIPVWSNATCRGSLSSKTVSFPINFPDYHFRGSLVSSHIFDGIAAFIRLSFLCHGGWACTSIQMELKMNGGWIGKFRCLGLRRRPHRGRGLGARIHVVTPIILTFWHNRTSLINGIDWRCSWMHRVTALYGRCTRPRDEGRCTRRCIQR